MHAGLSSVAKAHSILSAPWDMNYCPLCLCCHVLSWCPFISKPSSQFSHQVVTVLLCCKARSPDLIQSWSQRVTIEVVAIPSNFIGYSNEKLDRYSTIGKGVRRAEDRKKPPSFDFYYNTLLGLFYFRITIVTVL